MNEIRIRLNVPMLGHKAGRELVIPTDEEGNPLNINWRQRLKDAEHDGCITVVEPDPPAEPLKKKKDNRP